jgi:hypothetical protein
LPITALAHPVTRASSPCRVCIEPENRSCLLICFLNGLEARVTRIAASSNRQLEIGNRHSPQ